MYHYELFPRSVDTDRYISFMRNLKAKHGTKRLILYADNLRIHKSKRTMEVYEELNIIPIWAPIYSPALNPIEYCFSKLKGYVRK